MSDAFTTRDEEFEKLLAELDSEYNRKTNALIERHAEQVIELKEKLTHAQRCVGETVIEGCLSLSRDLLVKDLLKRAEAAEQQIYDSLPKWQVNDIVKEAEDRAKAAEARVKELEEANTLISITASEYLACAEVAGKDVEKWQKYHDASAEDAREWRRDAQELFQRAEAAELQIDKMADQINSLTNQLDKAEDSAHNAAIDAVLGTISSRIPFNMIKEIKKMRR
jgi:uncharacterized coiled-coil protein SlyX